MDKLTDRQKEIIHASIKIIAEDGIQNLTVKNISKSIGFTEAALYRHYDSKHKILLSILDLFGELSQISEFPIKNEISTLGNIEYFLLDRYTKFTKNKNFAKVIFSEALFINDPELSNKTRDIMRGNKILLEKCIISGQKRGEINPELDPISIFRTIIGSMRLLVTQWCYNNYSFHLKNEGMKLWKNIQIMIKGDIK